MTVAAHKDVVTDTVKLAPRSLPRPLPPPRRPSIIAQLQPPSPQLLMELELERKLDERREQLLKKAETATAWTVADFQALGMMSKLTIYRLFKTGKLKRVMKDRQTLVGGKSGRALLGIPEKEKPRKPDPRPRSYLIDHFVEAVRTGEHCSVPSYWAFEAFPGPSHYAMLSPHGMNLLERYGLLPEALKRVAEIKDPHPKAQQRYKKCWYFFGWSLRGIVDDDVTFKALRVLLPPYDGPPLKLYRGQVAGQWVGPSWTTNYDVALKFARNGLGYDQRGFGPGDIVRIPRLLWPVKRAFVIKATMHREIISGPIDPLKSAVKYAEHVVDPRDVDYEVFETIDAQIKQGGRPW